MGSTMQTKAYPTHMSKTADNTTTSGNPIKTIGKYSTAIQDQLMSPKSFNMIKVMQT